MDRPLISVILPTYNGGKYLDETLRSVLNQSYNNLEIIIIDDNSTDNTIDIVKSYTDKRIRFYQNEKNLGIAENSNKAISLAKGKYIMMQDHDDISMPKRAEMCAKFLEANKDIDGVGTRSHRIGGRNDSFIDNSEPWVELDAEEVYASEIFDRVIFHPTIMYRKELAEKLGEKVYAGEYKVVSDDELFYRFRKLNANFVLLGNKYLKYREHGNNTSRNKRKLHYQERKMIGILMFQNLLPFATDEELHLHLKALSFKEPLSYFGEFNNWSIDWYRKIINYNIESGRYNHNKLLKIMGRYWYKYVSGSNMASPFKAIKMYHSIEEIKPYLHSKRYLLRRIRKKLLISLKWKLRGNKNI